MALKVWSMHDIEDECVRKADQVQQTLFFYVLLSTRKVEIQQMVAALIEKLSNSNGKATVTYVLKRATWGVPYKELQVTLAKPAPVRLQPVRQPAPNRTRKALWEMNWDEFSAWLNRTDSRHDDTYT